MALKSGLTEIITVTIPNGEAVSAPINTGGQPIMNIGLDPAGWTAAGLSFECSYDGITWMPINDISQVQITWTVTFGYSISIDDVLLFAGYPYIRLVSGTSVVYVNQAAARTFKAAVMYL